MIPALGCPVKPPRTPVRPGAIRSGVGAECPTRASVGPFYYVEVVPYARFSYNCYYERAIVLSAEELVAVMVIPPVVTLVSGAAAAGILVSPAPP
jgi:hypothetical protein